MRKLLCFAAALLISVVAYAAPPNTLIVIVDDLGYADGTGTNPACSLPHLETFATSAVRCTRGYSPASICSQARAGLLTGQEPHRFGYWSLDQALPSLAAVPQLPDLLKNTHRTYVIGKWHHDTGYALDRGWQHSYGFRAATRWYVPYGGTSAAVSNGMYAYPGPQQHFVNQHLERDGVPIFPEPEGHLTDWLADEVLSVMRANDPKPWLVWFAPLACHGPNHKFHTNPAYYAIAEGAINTPQKAYRAQALHLDARLGEVLAEAEAREALILVTADNGGAVVYGADNSPLLGGKEEHTEGGLRVPMFWKWGNRFPPRNYDACVSGIDFAPTVLAASGVPIPAVMQGKNLHPYLTGSLGSAEPHETLEWDRSQGASYQQPKTRLECASGLKRVYSDPPALKHISRESILLNPATTADFITAP